MVSFELNHLELGATGDAVGAPCAVRGASCAGDAVGAWCAVRGASCAGEAVGARCAVRGAQRAARIGLLVASQQDLAAALPRSPWTATSTCWALASTIADMPGSSQRNLAGFLADLEAPGFSFGEWRGSDRQPNGAIQMPWFDYSPRAREVISAAARAALLPGFDWMRWSEGPDWHRLWNAPGGIEAASIDDLKRLLTALIRGDRFTEGTVVSAFESGHLIRIVRRWAELHELDPEGPPGSDAAPRP